MPLPLPIMIPFMMWQSAAIAAGFGTYFQFAKRKVSAMSNDEFNSANPHDLVNAMYNDIVQQIPSSFAKVDSLTPVMLQSMNTMLDQAVKWLQGAITGNIFGTPNPVNTELPALDVESGIDITLLNPDANEISSFSDTKIFDIVQQNKLSLYTLEAQAIIKQIYGIRIELNRQKPIEPEPRVEIPTEPVPEGFLSTLTPENYPPLHIIALTKIQNAGSYAESIRLASVQWSSNDFKCKNEREAIARDLYCRMKTAWGNLIVAMNKAVSAKLPYTL